MTPLQSYLRLLLFVEMPFYAVAVGKLPGIYKTWEECLNQTKGYPKAKYKKFNTEVEASKFINTNAGSGGGSSHNLTPSSALFLPENINPPELKPVNNYSSHTLLKRDKLSLIAEKLDNFIEQTNKKLTEFSNRLDIIETSFLFKNSPDGKRKNDSAEVVGQRQPKKTKTTASAIVSDDDTTTVSTRNKSQSINWTVEEVDGPFGSNNSSSAQGFITGPDGYVVVYTDGACSNNGKHQAKAGIGVWFNHNNPFNLAAPVEGNATNNNAEIQAAARAIEQASLAGVKRLNIHTDSQFMINCITDWIKKWKKNNWMTSNGGPVKNKEQLIILDNAIRSMEDVKWTHIRGHMGNEGNECADTLARSGATMYSK